MKRFNIHNDGFTLVEIVLTLALIGAVLTPLLAIQYNILGSTIRSYARLSRTFLMENLLGETAQQLLSDEKEIKPSEKKFDEYQTVIRAEAINLPGSSSLKEFDDITLIRVKATWQELGLNRQETMIGLRYKERKKA